MVALSNSMPSSDISNNSMKPLSGGPGVKMSGGGRTRRAGGGRNYSGSLLSTSYLNSGATDKSSGVNNIAFLGGRRRRKTKRKSNRKSRKSRRRRH